jgi:hypothetical protein
MIINEVLLFGSIMEISFQKLGLVEESINTKIDTDHIDFNFCHIPNIAE